MMHALYAESEVCMELKNCRKCGRMFNYVMGMPICPACKEKAEQTFQTVKKYIEENKGATIQEVSEACEVETSQIHQWIREERLAFSDDSPIRIPCEGCGAMIGSGKYCDKCRVAMQRGFSSAIEKSRPADPQPKKDPRESARMRFLDTK